VRARLRFRHFTQCHSRVRGRPQRQANLQRDELAVRCGRWRVVAQKFVFVRLRERNVRVGVPENIPGQLLRQMEDVAVRPAQAIISG
jgi:hypothetical protein